MAGAVGGIKKRPSPTDDWFVDHFPVHCDGGLALGEPGLVGIHDALRPSQFFWCGSECCVCQRHLIWVHTELATETQRPCFRCFGFKAFCVLEVGHHHVHRGDLSEARRLGNLGPCKEHLQVVCPTNSTKVRHIVLSTEIAPFHPFVAGYLNGIDYPGDSLQAGHDRKIREASLSQRASHAINIVRPGKFGDDYSGESFGESLRDITIEHVAVGVVDTNEEIQSRMRLG